MLPVALSRKITVFQRIGASARTAANRSIVTQARRREKKATYKQHLAQLTRIKRIKRECDHAHADYLENKRISSRLEWMQENDIACPWANEHRNSLKIYAPELAHL